MHRAPLLGVVAVLLAGGAAAALASFDPTPGDVYRVWLDGRQANLTNSPDNDTAPLISPDGTRVAFASDEGIAQPVHIFVVGSDGNGRQSVSPALTREQDYAFALAWSPDGKRLALGTVTHVDPDREVWSLYLLTPGAGPKVLARARSVDNPSWSPDGRVIAFLTPTRVWGVTPAGKVLWRLKGFSYLQGGRSWSATGLLALLNRGRLAVYDERGRQRIKFFPARSFAWAPRGRRLATVAANRLEVRSLSGRVVFKKAVPGLKGHNGLVWADSRHVVIGGIGGGVSDATVTVDVGTGRIVRGGRSYFGTLSPDKTLTAETVAVGKGYELRVSRLDGSDVRTLWSSPNCPDLIESDAQWFPDGQSLAVDFRCQER